MAHKTIIGTAKKRHMVTLSEATVARFQSICKEINLPPATLSNALDDALKILVEQMEVARAAVKKGSGFPIAELFKQAGQQMELIEREMKDNVKSASKTKAVADPFKQGRYPIGKSTRK